jgi:DNA-binding transcriptional LysR family regulator
MTSWEDLRIFLAVARAGSATGAAAALGVSQPTVSRRLASLSRSLAVELARGGPRGLALTPAGVRLRDRLERVDAGIHGALRAVERGDVRAAGSVRLSAPEGLGLARIAPRLDAFRRAHPDIDLVLAAESSVANLSRREADLALRMVRPRQRELVLRRVATIAFAPYASPRYLRRRPRGPGGGVSPDDDVVGLRESMQDSPQAAWVRSLRPSPRIRVRVQTPVGLQAALLAGAGVGLLPAYLGDVPGLRRVGPAPALHRDLYLVHHRALRGVERVRIAARFVESCLEGLGHGEAPKGGAPASGGPGAAPHGILSPDPTASPRP